MFSLRKFATSIAVAATVLMTSAINVFADDYQFDLSKASRTFGKGTSYVHYTRLDNERMDKNNFNPLWMTKDSTMEVEFEAAGEYDTAPVSITFQSWTGEKVAGTEDKIVRIFPSTFTESTATFTYDDMVQWYGTDDFSDVYCVRIEDNGNQILATSLTVTNCNIPEDEAENVKGTIIKTETEAAETEAPVEETEVTTEENTSSSETTNKESEETATSTENSDTLNDSTNTTESTDDKTNDSDKNESSSSSPVLIIAIAGGAVVIIAVVIVIIVLSKKKKKSKHRFH